MAEVRLGRSFPKQAVIATLLICCMGISGCAAQAPDMNLSQGEGRAKPDGVDQMAEWKATIPKYQNIMHSNMSKDEKCTAIWQMQWNLAKAGNLEARYSIQNYLEQKWHVAGRPHDDLTRYRDVATIFLHSLGSQRLYLQMMHTSKNIYVRLMSRYAPAITDNAQLVGCIMKESSQACTKIAVEAGLIPTFEQFAAEFDKYLDAGAKVQCNP